MTRYTVTYTRTAFNALAGQWLNADDRRAVTLAGDEIDRQLSVDAPNKGELQREGFRRLVVSPLEVLFTVEEDDRLVTIWSVRIAS
jgi:hypothetical protein